jgi:hypothetical protein
MWRVVIGMIVIALCLTIGAVSDQIATALIEVFSR